MRIGQILQKNRRDVVAISLDVIVCAAITAMQPQVGSVLVVDESSKNGVLRDVARAHVLAS